MFDLFAGEMNFENISMLTVAPLYKPPLGQGQRFVKRLEDLALAISLLILFSPLMLVIALVIKLDNPGSVFFKSKVLGKNGEPFLMYKFRSMISNADDSKHRIYIEKYVKEGKAADKKKRIYKLTKDKRITRVGRWIRKYSLDEIPQLWNVILGDQSVVGPRPPLPYEYDHYDKIHKKRLYIKPGITGLWQVNGKSCLSFEQMIVLDLYYISKWSLWLDLKILLETVLLVLKGENY